MSLNFDSHFREPHHTLTASFVEELFGRTAHWFAGAAAGVLPAPHIDSEWTGSENGVRACTDHPLTSRPAMPPEFGEPVSNPSFDVFEIEEFPDDRPPLTHWGIND